MDKLVDGEKPESKGLKTDFEMYMEMISKHEGAGEGVG